jgi:hypothetical protein
MRRRNLRFEALERRLLLAGDVNVTFNRGTLNVTGDGGDNHFQVEYIAPDTYRVTGIDTNVRGIDEYSGVLSVNVNMSRGGNNRVEIKGTEESRFVLPGNLTIQGGSGNDVVVVEWARINGQVTINTGMGNDRVLVQELDAPAAPRVGFTINTSHGNNQVAVVDSVIARNINITTGNNNDQVGLVNVKNAATINIRTGHGAKDQIGIAGVEATNILLDGGNAGRGATRGTAEIGVTGTTLNGNLTIQTGIGDDQVGVGNNAWLIDQIEGLVAEVLGEEEFDLGSAADTVRVTGNVSITTNTGSDTVLIEDLIAAPTPRAGFTINTSHGNNQIVVLESNIARNINITTGNNNDQVGLVNVKNAANIAIRTGHGAKDQIGIAGVEAASILLDGGNFGRGATPGTAEIGVTGTTLTGNLTIQTGNGSDRVGVGNNAQLIAEVQGILDAALPDGAAFSLEDAAGPVEVTGNVSISTNFGNDEVLVEDLNAPLNGPARVTINTGNGNNQVGVVNSSIQRPVSVITGMGRDGVWIRELTGTTGLSINTGGGDDEIGIVDTVIPGNIMINTGTSSPGAGDSGDRVGLIRVTAGNMMIVNDSGNAGFGLAEVNAGNVTLDGGNAVNRRGLAFGPSVIGVTNSTLANLTIRQGHPPDGVFIGIEADLEAGFQLVDPASGNAIEYEMGVVNVAGGTININTNVPGRNPGGDVVRLSHLHAQSLIVDTGLGSDWVRIGANVFVTQNLRITTGADDDWLTIEPSPADFWAKITAPRQNVTIDGGLGNDTLHNRNPSALRADAAFSRWTAEDINLPISGYKWHDLNRNGVWDDGEPGLQGWKIQAMQGTNVVAEVETDENGFYSFRLPGEKEYTFQEVLKPGWTQSWPTIGTYTQLLAWGQVYRNYNFGNHT